EDLQSAEARSKLTGLTLDAATLCDFDQPVKARYTFEVPALFQSDGLVHSLDSLDGSVAADPLSDKLLRFRLDPARQVELDLKDPFEMKFRYVVKLPPAYRLKSASFSRTSRSAWGTLQRSVKRPSGESPDLEIEFVARLEKTRVRPADFEAFRKFVEDARKTYRVQLDLEPIRTLTEAK